MATSIEPMGRRFLASKFFIPGTVLLWLLVALPLWLLATGIAQAQSTCDANLNDSNWSKWVYSPGRLILINSCKTAKGTLVYGERWGDNDYDWYVKLDNPSSLGVTSSDAGALQKYDECGKGFTSDQTKWCDFIAETIPQDQQEEPPYCLDSNLTGKNVRTPAGSCKDKYLSGQGYRVEFTGALVTDNGHSLVWKEIHPQVRQKIYDSSGRLLVDQTGAKRPG